MKILFLDIASHQGLLVLCTETSVIAFKGIDHRIQDDELIGCFENILKKAGWKSNNVTHIACVIGPGGFTSLRVGVAFANALAWSLKIPIVGIHLSDLYIGRMTTNYQLPTTNYVWLHSTKKNELFVRGFGKYAKKWGAPTHMNVKELTKEIPKGVRWVGELIPEHEEWLTTCNVQHATLNDVLSILPSFLSKQSYSNKSVIPWYGRAG